MGGFLSDLKPTPNSEVLNATCGPVRGNIYTHDSKIVHGYLGIPYAQPPVGRLRFKKPEPADTWETPRDCYKYGPIVPQSGDKVKKLFPPGYHEQDESHGLNLNVFGPSLKSVEFPNGYPVMVYFHGGGFSLGLSSSFDDYSLSGTLPLKEVIVVTVNYRVGPLGFFTTGDDVARGNYGLWDMTLSLHWVQKHIESFGGDPNCVTVFGSSAGAMSAAYLALSPHSNKLFHRYMPMSGAAYNDFFCRPKKVAAQLAKNFAKHHGYTGEDSQSLLAWYQAQPNSKWFETTDVDKSGASGFALFCPVFDEEFFPKPFDVLQKEAPKLDVLVTVNEHEALEFLGMYPNRTSDLEVISSVFGADIVRHPEEVQKRIYDFYMEGVDQNDTKAVELKLINFLSDTCFNYAALETVRHSTRAGSNAYLASFDYYNMDSKDPNASGFPFKAANHNSELKYMLGEGMGKFEPVPEEYKVIDLMGNLVTNFAKYGNPNTPNGPQIWEKYSFSNPLAYFKIDYPKMEMRDNFQDGRLKIFDEINKSGEKYQGILYELSS